MSNLHPVFEQVLRTFAPPAATKTPRFAMTSCSQCGRDTGLGDAGHSSCATHGPKASGFDLSDLIEYRFSTDTGFTLRCYLEHDEEVSGGGDAHPSTKERVDLRYAFAGSTDVCELVDMVPGLQAKIEAEALAAKHARDKDDRTEAAIARFEDRMAA
jgi:hypothetical protein